MHVSGAFTITTDDLNNLNGLWVDGGTLNNLPIRAFNETALSALNPNVLGLRLQPGFNPQAGFKDSTEYQKLLDHRLTLYGVLLNHVKEVFETLMYPSEDGQLIESTDVEQTINLYTEDLSTLEFSPNPEISKFAIDGAEKQVFDYFN